MPPTPNTGLRRVLFHGGEVSEGLGRPPSGPIEARPFRPESFFLADDGIAVVLCDAALAPMLGEPPPPALGSGADRAAVLLGGEGFELGTDPFWTARTLFSLSAGTADAHLERAPRAFSEERKLRVRDHEIEEHTLEFVGICREWRHGRKTGGTKRCPN
ncbi:MAG: hypothetical protein ACRD3M_01975 [Thermoanaerobaculia bacterium]